MCAHIPLFCEENFNYVVEVFVANLGEGQNSTFSKVPLTCFQGSKALWENQIHASFILFFCEWEQRPECVFLIDMLRAGCSPPPIAHILENYQNVTKLISHQFST